MSLDSHLKCYIGDQSGIPPPGATQTVCNSILHIACRHRAYCYWVFIQRGGGGYPAIVKLQMGENPTHVGSD